MREIIGQQFEELFLDAMGATLNIQANGRFWAEDGGVTKIEIAHAPIWTSQGYRAPNSTTVIEAGERGAETAIMWCLLERAIKNQFEHEIAQTIPVERHDYYSPIRISARVG